MAGKVVEKKADVCKHCDKPGFKGKDGKMQHERRGDPAVYGGRRSDPAPSAGGKVEGDKGKKVEEQEPNRDHALHRRLWGKGKDDGRQ